MRCNNTTKNAIIAENNIEVIVVLGNIAYICSEALQLLPYPRNDKEKKQ